MYNTRVKSFFIIIFSFVIASGRVVKNTVISCEVWPEMLTRAKVPVVLLTTFAQSKCQHSEYLVSTNMKIILTSATPGVFHSSKVTVMSVSYYFYVM